jgi:hypothetical protein
VVADAVEGLTAEHRARIEAALPPGKVMSPEAWAELEECVVGYRIFKTRRLTYPIVKHRKYREHMDKAVATITLGLCRDDMWPGDTTWWRPDALAAMSAIRRRVEALAAFHDMWSAFGRRQNPHREFLYWGVMRVWTDRLGGKLRYSNSPEGPSGPLVRFFVACVEPILRKQTPQAGIADIIDREREARAKTEDDKRRMGF